MPVVVIASIFYAFSVPRFYNEREIAKPGWQQTRYVKMMRMFGHTKFCAAELILFCSGGGAVILENHEHHFLS